jgi:predicted O-methyltransferase YrrM
MQLLKTALFRVGSFVRWRLKVRGHRWLHSPFHFELYTALKAYRLPQESLYFQQSERNNALKNHTLLMYEDAGAGSLAHKKTTISLLAKNSVLPLKSFEKLAAMATHVKPQFVLELGSSLGYTCAGLAQVMPQVPVHSIEAAEPVYSYALDVGKRAGLQNLTLHLGRFKEVLPGLLPLLSEKGPGLVIVDGHHTYEATVFYAGLLFQYLAPGSVIVFDDIYWSPEMKRAWNEILALQPMGSSIDGFRAGWVFLNPDLASETFYWKIT